MSPADGTLWAIGAGGMLQQKRQRLYARADVKHSHEPEPPICWSIYSVRVEVEIFSASPYKQPAPS